MIGNRGIISSFTPNSYSNSIELVDAFRTPIQDIGTATITPTLHLSYVFYLHHFPYKILSISKITRVLNCTVIVFLTHCIFHELGTGKTGTRREWNGLYELEFTSDQVACISTSIAFDYHCQLGHLSLHTLKLFSDLGQVESYQLRKHQLYYPSRVNKMVDKLFDLVHSDVWDSCSLPSKLKFRYFVSIVNVISPVNYP